mgnify:CR=1 FL=1
MSGGFLEDEDVDEEKEEVIDVEAEEVSSEPAPPANTGGDGLVRPTAELEEVAEVYETFENMKNNLLKGADKQTIGSGSSKSTFITKSGWRKIATAFNVSVEVVEKEKTVDDGVLTWKVKARATANNGKTAESWSACASNESNHMEYLQSVDDEMKAKDDVFKVDGKWRRLKHPREVNEHDIIATAETRAKNRAISDLVGGGDVSAEEVTKESVLGE